LPILDSDDRRSTSARLAYKRLAPASVNADEAKLSRTKRHRLIAYEAAPLGPLTLKCPKFSRVAPNDNLGCAVDHNFKPALGVIASSANVGATALARLVALGERAQSSQK
jgi:hypothetical protein